MQATIKAKKTKTGTQLYNNDDHGWGKKKEIYPRWEGLVIQKGLLNWTSGKQLRTNTHAESLFLKLDDIKPEEIFF